MFGLGIVEAIGNFIKKKKLLGLYSEDQIHALRELQDHYMTEEESEFTVGPSSGSSSWSPPASGGRVLTSEYFHGLEERLEKLGIEEEEFFKKEEFDIEE